jgi:superfamily II DNA or RNA helicase
MTDHYWQDFFDEVDIDRGVDLLKRDAVKKCREDEEQIVKGTVVAGVDRFSPEVEASTAVIVDGKLHVARLRWGCTCQRGRDPKKKDHPCGHAAALLWSYQNQRLAGAGFPIIPAAKTTSDHDPDPEPAAESVPAGQPGKPARPRGRPPAHAPQQNAPPQKRPDPEVPEWTGRTSWRAVPALPAPTAAPAYECAAGLPRTNDQAIRRLFRQPETPAVSDLFFVLDRNAPERVRIALVTGQLQDGLVRRIVQREMSLLQSTAPGVFPSHQVTDEDRLLLGALLASGKMGQGRRFIDLAESSCSGELLTRLLATGRLVTDEFRPLAPAAAIAAKPTWVAIGTSWRLSLSEPAIVLATSPAMVLIGTSLSSMTGITDERIVAVSHIPAMDEVAASHVARLLGVPMPVPMAPKPAVPIARVWRSTALRKDSTKPFTIELVTLVFRYGRTVVKAFDPSVRLGDGTPRDLTTEIRALEGVTASGLDRITDAVIVREIPTDIAEHTLVPLLPSSRADTVPLSPRALAILREHGWNIATRDDQFQELTVVEESRLVAEAGRQFGSRFELHIGVQVDQGQVDLVPVLLSLLEAGDDGVAALERCPEDPEQVYLPIGPLRVIQLHRARLARLLGFITAMCTRVGKQVQIERLALGTSTLLDLVPRWLDRKRFNAIIGDLRLLLEPGTCQEPSGFRGSLRAYQRTGLAWLQRLRETGHHGILADDMGLGKTVQILAHLEIERAAGRLTTPALIVAPASVVGNWIREARAFLPQARVLLFHGALRDPARLDGQDLVITTYGTLIRDQVFMQRRWSHLVCDEAQCLKNDDVKAAQVVRAIAADLKLSLTGTPVENHLGELWAQMNWLVPEVLGSKADFERVFRTPIERHQNQTRMELLRGRMSPFMLRRTKEAVAADLPPKTACVIRVPLDDEQRDLYEAVRLAMDARIAAALTERSSNQSRFVVLDALLRLRQTCCDPSLVKTIPHQVTRSAKLDALMELLSTMTAEGRRILVFSQFTTMLDLIAARLASAGMTFSMLTGEIPVAKRDELVQSFQQGRSQVFLISLKAGGAGLNLQAADTVVLYDPWWNPAVEDQAIDRAHRIGQDKPVFVYRLVAEGTLEERILDLQARKQALADAVYGDEEQVASRLSDDDLKALFAPITRLGT